MQRLWTINGRFLTQPVTGVQRYAQEIVLGLDALLGENHPLASQLELELLVPPGTARRLDLKAIRTHASGRVHGHYWEQLVLPRHVRNGLVSLGNTGPIAVRRQVVCIHDTNTRSFPAAYSLAFRLLYRGLLPILGRVAQKIATVSRYSAGELIRNDISVQQKIVLIPGGHEHALQWRARHSRATRTLAGLDTVLALGSLAPHKNLGLVLGLADKLAGAGLRIAVAGQCDPRVFSAHDTIPKAENIFYLGRVSDAELAALLRDSLCLAFPSLAEGFGLPALEAMALQCPVVASDRASLPEICGDAALYASPTEPDRWLAHILRLRGDEALRADLVARGRAQAAKFSWKTSAELYLRAMAEIDAQRSAVNRASSTRT